MITYKQTWLRIYQIALKERQSPLYPTGYEGPITELSHIVEYKPNGRSKIIFMTPADKVLITYFYYPSNTR